MNKNIAILGCGWLGKPLAVNLIRSDCNVVGTTTSIEKLEELKKEGIIPYLFSLENENTWNRDIFNNKILIIAIPSKNEEAFRIFVNFIKNTAVQKIIFISSTSIYSNENKTVSENSKVLQSPLVTIENLFKNNAQFKTTIIRFAGLFGYDRKPGNFFKERSIPNPEGFINMIHRDDCIALIKKIIEKNCFGEIFNGVGDTHPTRREFYTKAALILGKEKPDFIETGESSFKIVSNKKSKEKLQFSYSYGNILASLEF